MSSNLVIGQARRTHRRNSLLTRELNIFSDRIILTELISIQSGGAAGVVMTTHLRIVCRRSGLPFNKPTLFCEKLAQRHLAASL